MQYDVKTMLEVILACCILHNFLLGVDLDKDLIAKVDRDLISSQVTNEVPGENTPKDEDSRRGEMLRDNIAIEMWRDYMADH